MRRSKRLLLAAAVLLAALCGALLLSGSASAQPASAAAPRQVAEYAARGVSDGRLSVPAVPSPTAPHGPSGPKAPAGGTDSSSNPSINIQVDGKPSTSLNILLLVTVLSLAPSLLIMVTSFTKIFIVLSLTRNALGLSTVPPNQVIAGLSLFLSMFVMAPVLKKVNSLGIQPYLHGTKSRHQAWVDGTKPLRDFMLAHTRPEELALMLRAGNLPNPHNVAKLDLTTIIPAFVLSELRAAMIIGFIVYIPFVIIDLVVSSSLMSLGMMMLPPVSVSLPFKLLLFVLVDGWGLVVTSLVQSYHTG